MLKEIILASTLTLVATTTAFANPCADQIKLVEDAMSAETVAPSARAQAGDLLAKAKEQQAAGDDKACVTFLTEAASLLAGN